MIYTTSNSFIINNHIVSKLNTTGIIISPLSRFIKNNININHSQKKTYGSKVMDNFILSQLSEGKISFSMVI